MKSILLIRHAQQDSKLENEPLCENGHKQSQYLAHRLKLKQFDKIYVSTLLRAKQTAQYFINEVDIDIIETDDLKEIYGVIVGDNPKPESRPNREQEDREQAKRITSRLLNEQGNIVVFTHGNLIRYILSQVMGIESEPAGYLNIYHCSGSLIHFRKDGIFIKFVNKTYLPNELRTNMSL